jgi:ATP-dependent Lon protease
MQESVKAAKSYIRSKSLEFGIIPPIFDKKDFHIHVPEGATPKDGPSAGVGMVTSIISAITEIPVDKNVAMTGEITLRGIILPIGGLKEKLLAAHRAGIKKVLIPFENKKDLVEVPEAILESMEIIAVQNVDEVLKTALTKPLKRVEWVEVDQISNKTKSKEELSTH